ncbi:hypothetical protein [Micromonospora purpureochromogenes]|uniref:Uncharacterized protein n=1 Tax=Micromonospora purpureochromogenes TaxID=47872 RepID=A0ABX2RPB1_9ACTN|nr:hypothetical protein [Micromonospora purpureochromogenes]NYF57878.1 hypothetical protein [Micromonospora purpureochromogenes]
MKLDRTTTLILAAAAIASASALILSLAAVSAATYDAPSGQDGPMITDWMQAWGSVGGVVAGLAAAGAAAFLLLHERERAAAAERQLAEERAEHALNVPRAVVVTPARFGGGSNGLGEQHINQVVLTVHNYSSTVIRNVAIIVALPDGGPRLLLPRPTMIGPGENWPVNQNSGKPVRSPSPSDISTWKATVTVCFIDYTNQAWQITSDGEVSRTTAPYPAEEGVLKFPVA